MRCERVPSSGWQSTRVFGMAGCGGDDGGGGDVCDGARVMLCDSM